MNLLKTDSKFQLFLESKEAVCSKNKSFLIENNLDQMDEYIKSICSTPLPENYAFLLTPISRYGKLK